MASNSSVILAIESSCDETSAAVLIDGIVASNIVSTQLDHARWGGVIPEIASRLHVESIHAVVSEALQGSKISLSLVTTLACTTKPGLVGALLVGANFAKGLAVRCNILCVPVHHIEGHLYSGFLENPELKFPAVVLVVSGGHTSLFHVESYNKYSVLGSTRDDAAGEAFDKTAKVLGLGYPGGPLIDKVAQNGNPHWQKFPRALMDNSNFEFSFSGLKTSVVRFINQHYQEGVPNSILPDLCASIQSAIVDVLVTKLIRASQLLNINNIVVAGGVAANSALRSTLIARTTGRSIHITFPRQEYCIDNAAMIGHVAHKKLLSDADQFLGLDFVVGADSLRDNRHRNGQPKKMA